MKIKRIGRASKEKMEWGTTTAGEEKMIHFSIDFAGPSFSIDEMLVWVHTPLF